VVRAAAVRVVAVEYAPARAAVEPGGGLKVEHIIGVIDVARVGGIEPVRSGCPFVIAVDPGRGAAVVGNGDDRPLLVGAKPPVLAAAAPDDRLVHAVRRSVHIAGGEPARGGIFDNQGVAVIDEPARHRRRADLVEPAEGIVAKRRGVPAAGADQPVLDIVGVGRRA
jgi:hypothetical protein